MVKRNKNRSEKNILLRTLMFFGARQNSKFYVSVAGLFGKPTSKNDDAVSTVRALIRRGQYPSALSALDKLDHDAKETASLYAKIAAGQHDKGFKKDALASYKRAFELNPNSAQIRLGYGRALRSDQSISQSVSALSPPDSIEFGKEKLARLRYERGLSFRALKQDDKAIADFRAAIDGHPKGIFALVDLVETLTTAGKIKDALKVLDRYGEHLAPDVASLQRAQVLRHRAKLMKASKRKEARSALMEANKLAPQDSWIALDYGQILYETGQYKTALDALLPASKVASKKRTSAKLHNEIGRNFHKLKRIEEAVAAFRKSAELDPTATSAVFEAIKILRREKRFDEAWGLLAGVEATAPPQVVAWHKARILRERGIALRSTDPAAAAAALAEAFSLAPNDLDIVLDYGRILHNSKKFENSLKVLSTLADSENAGAGAAKLHFEIAKNLHRLGRIEDAVAAFRKSAELDPTATSAAFEAIKILRREKRFDEAWGLLAGVEATAPPQTVAWHKACILRERGIALRSTDPAAAAAALAEAFSLAPNDLDIVLDYGRILHNSKKFENSLKVLSTLADSENAGAGAAKLHFEIAKNLHRLGRIEDAVAAFRKSAELDPTATSAAFEAIKILRREKRFDEAWGLLAGVEATAPPQTVAWHKACILRERGIALRSTDPAAAAAALAEAFSLAPNDLDIVLDYGRILHNSKKFENSLKVLSTLADSENAGAGAAKLHFEIGRNFRKLNEIESALSAFGRSLDIDPAMASAALEASQMLWQQGQGEEALAFLDRGPTGQLREMRLRATLMVALDRLDDAEPIFEELARQQEISISQVKALAYEEAKLHEEALQYNLAVLAEQPDDAVTHLRVAKIYRKTKRPELALATSQRVIQLDPENRDAYHFAAESMRALAMFSEAEALFKKALEINPLRIATMLDLADLRLIAGDLQDALFYTEKALEQSNTTARAYLLDSRINYEMGNLEKALIACEAAYALDPENTRIQSQLSLIRLGNAMPTRTREFDLCILAPIAVDQFALVKTVAPKFTNVIVSASVDAAVRESVPNIVQLPQDGDWKQQVLAGAAKDVVIAKSLDGLEKCEDLLKGAGIGVGIVTTTDQFDLCGWQRESLESCIDTFRPQTYDELISRSLASLRVRYLDRQDLPQPLSSGDIGQGREAWLVSSSGIKLFGGVEQFLRSMVPVYRSLGFKPVIVGLLEKTDDHLQEGEVDGIPFINLRRNVSNFRELALHRNPAIVHATTGIGYEMIGALNGLQSRLIYGTHFWRDMFHGSGSFENIDINGRIRGEFGLLCARVDQAYANSVYTRDAIRTHFGMSQPIVYSLPFDAAGNDNISKPGEYVLLMNGRPDKGLNIALQAAARLPNVPFKIVASQVSAERVESQIRELGLNNVTVIDFTDDTATLYRNSRVVLVPSYAFIETFSRVVIEAQRHGIPVIGSDRGNVPILLKASGIHLPEETDRWVEEIDRLFSDDAYWHNRSRMALKNSDLYPYAEQKTRIDRLVRTSLKRIAIGVGSGIGNIIQCTPVIRQVAEYFGAPVDIILRQDFPGCESIFEGSEWVGSVMPADSYASVAHYDAILLLDCFGALIPHFNTDRLLVARRRFPFNMTRNMHESEFYLMCAKEFLGVPYTTEDAAKYFFGNLTMQGEKRRVGVHAGCKTGVWMAKRWPYFEELVARLQSDGFEVCSFGSADEYVEGTTNWTATDLETTARNIASCGYFVANDSGLMHIADALEIPLTTIFAPTSVVKNGPLKATSRVVKIQKDCSPCQFDANKLEQCTCIAEISLEEVYEAVKADLRADDASDGVQASRYQA